MTTYAAFITSIRSMVVTGVTAHTAPPTVLHTADLPASWPMLPNGQDDQLTFASGGNTGAIQPTMTVDLVFALEPVGQDTQIANYTALVALIDTVVAASRALTRPTRGPMSYTIRTAIVQVGQVAYWGIIQTWTGVG